MNSFCQKDRWQPEVVRRLPWAECRNYQESVPTAVAARNVDAVVEGQILHSSGYSRGIQPGKNGRRRRIEDGFPNVLRVIRVLGYDIRVDEYTVRFPSPHKRCAAGLP